MSRGWRFALTALSILVLAGCAGFDYKHAKEAKPGGSPFDQALYKEYLAQSKTEYDQANYTSSDKWARNAIMASKGQTPKPTAVSDWTLPSAVAPEMTTARQRLQAGLDKGGGNVAPDDMAKAQVGWDCWAEQQRVEENFQPEDIAHCRQTFYHHIAKVEEKFITRPPETCPPNCPPVIDSLVFFDWNESVLTAEAKKIIAKTVSDAKKVSAKTFSVTGFTDRSGPADYNLRLSVRRAEAVRAEMVRLGIPAGAITIEGRGEADPLVPTADGVREPQNRRAAINFAKMGASLAPATNPRELVHIGIN